MAINFRRQIKKMMKEKGINACRLAMKAELNPSTVYKYLREESEIRSDNLEALLNTLRRLPEKKKIY